GPADQCAAPAELWTAHRHCPLAHESWQPQLRVPQATQLRRTRQTRHFDVSPRAKCLRKHRTHGTPPCASWASPRMVSLRTNSPKYAIKGNVGHRQRIGRSHLRGSRLELATHDDSMTAIRCAAKAT